MKKIIIVLSSIALFAACSKKEDAPPGSATTTGTTSSSSNQDSKLIGVWAQDSSKADNGPTGKSGKTFADTNFISTASFIAKMYNNSIAISTLTNTWTTSNDSLFLMLNGKYAGNHYKYSFIGNELELYLKCNVCAGYNIKYWYHKK